MKLVFHASSTARVVAVTGDNGYSSQALSTPAFVGNGDVLSIEVKPNRYLPPSSPWRLITDDGTILPWMPNGTTSAADIIDLYAQELAERRPA